MIVTKEHKAALDEVAKERSISPAKEVPITLESLNKRLLALEKVILSETGVSNG